MILLALELSLCLLLVPASMAKSTELNPTRAQFSFPALLGLNRNLPQEQDGAKSADENNMGNVEERRSDANRLWGDVLSRRETRNQFERILKDVLSDPARRDMSESTIRDIRSSLACKFNLGGHCATEEMDKLADSYYYLLSSSSPGRRRRFAAM